MNIPKHIAIIPDGNRRWAKEKGLPAVEGHRRGADSLNKLITKARDLGIRIFTFWGFSTENWNRESEEINNLMKLYEQSLNKHLKDALENKTRIIHIGRKDRIPKSLKEKLDNAEEKTKSFTDHYFVIGIDYGGRDEMIRAINKMKNQEKDFTQEDINQFLDTKDLPFPEPDLVIRTSGEYRTSGFMIWQGAYTEYEYVNKYFPDFSDKDLEKCVQDYGNRQRRFGK